MEVAKAKHREVAGEIEKTTKASAARQRGRMTIGDYEVIFKARLANGFGLQG